MIRLFTRLEQAYIAAATLESLAGPQSLMRPSVRRTTAVGSSAQAIGRSVASVAAPREQAADDLMQTTTAFLLGGGLRVGSVHYGSPGFIEVIGVLNPLKTVKDGITENREINRKRDETARLDEREREKQSMAHEQSMTQERRQYEDMRSKNEIEIAKLRMQAEADRFKNVMSLVDRLPPEQQTAATAHILQQLLQNTESLANDAKVGEARMLEGGDEAA
ncbi:MAG: hypothetical protein ACXVB2_25680 [Isosphaeraceae bacterium]